jgi:hypothetical protein
MEAVLEELRACLAELRCEICRKKASSHTLPTGGTRGGGGSCFYCGCSGSSVTSEGGSVVVSNASILQHEPVKSWGSTTTACDPGPLESEGSLARISVPLKSVVAKPQGLGDDLLVTWADKAQEEYPGQSADACCQKRLAAALAPVESPQPLRFSSLPGRFPPPEDSPRVPPVICEASLSAESPEFRHPHYKERLMATLGSAGKFRTPVKRSVLSEASAPGSSPRVVASRGAGRIPSPVISRGIDAQPEQTNAAGSSHRDPSCGMGRIASPIRRTASHGRTLSPVRHIAFHEISSCSAAGIHSPLRQTASHNILTVGTPLRVHSTHSCRQPLPQEMVFASPVTAATLSHSSSHSKCPCMSQSNCHRTSQPATAR